MRKIPKIKLNVEAIANKAEKKGLSVIDSDQRGMCYICEGDNILILTGAGGYLVMNRSRIEHTARELLDIISITKDRPLCWH